MDRMRVLYAATTHDRLRSYPFNLLLGLYNYMGRFACFPNKKTRIVGPFICRQKRIVAQFQFHDRSLVSHLTIDSTAYPFFSLSRARAPHLSLATKTGPKTRGSLARSTRLVSGLARLGSLENLTKPSQCCSSVR